MTGPLPQAPTSTAVQTWDAFIVYPALIRRQRQVKLPDGMNHPGLMHTSLVGTVALMPSKYDEQARAKAVRLAIDPVGDYESG